MTTGQRRIRRTLTSIDWGAVFRLLTIVFSVATVTLILSVVLP